MAGFTATDTVQGGTFSTIAQVPVLRLYQFLTTFTVQSGPDKGKPVLDGNAVSDKGLHPCRHACRLFYDLSK